MLLLSFTRMGCHHGYRSTEVWERELRQGEFTSTFSGDNQGFLSFAPAQGSTGSQSEHVGLLRGESCDGELPTGGAHLHCGPAGRVPDFQAVGDLVAWWVTGGGRQIWRIIPRVCLCGRVRHDEIRNSPHDYTGLFSHEHTFLQLFQLSISVVASCDPRSCCPLYVRGP